jgi:D-alanyl-D-alanine dipeptidase
MLTEMQAALLAFRRRAARAEARVAALEAAVGLALRRLDDDRPHGASMALLEARPRAAEAGSRAAHDGQGGRA